MKEKNRLAMVTLKVGTTASYRSINECPVNVTEYVIAYRKTSEFKSNPIWVESDYSEDYSHYIININDEPTKWKLINLNDLVYQKTGCKDWRDFKKRYGIDWKKKRYELKKEIAMAHPERVVSLNTLQKPSKAIKEVINKSKEIRDKVFVFHRENRDDVYCYNGRTLAFFKDKFRLIDNTFKPAEILTNLWSDISFLGIGPEGKVELPNGKKPEKLIRRIIELSTNPQDIVLDFFMGTGTTCAVAHKMGRQYIGIEQLDYGKNSAVVRLKNVINGDPTGISKEVNWQGGGDFVYMELMKLNENFVEKIRDAESTDEILNIWEDMKHNGFLSYRVDPRLLDKNIEEFKDLSLEEQKKLLLDMLEYNDLYVNYSEIDDVIYNVSEEDKKLNRGFYENQYDL